MNLFVLGLNHTTAPVAIREQVSVDIGQHPTLLKQLQTQHGLQGVVILSTCNRTEIYFSSLEESISKELFPQMLQLSVKIESSHLYMYHGAEVAAHLFRVIAGMNSMVIGEYQIVNQVKQAFSIALESGATNTLLNKLFQFALEANKTIRSRTAISKGAVSISYAASELCRRIFSSMEQIRALLIGTGETGQLAFRHLKEAGLKEWWVSNRTPQRGQEFTQRWGGEWVPFETFENYLSKVDLVLVATASPIPLVTRKMIKKALEQKNSTLCLIDLSVPRNIEPEVNTLEEVICYNVDDLQEIVASNLAFREKEAKRAEQFIQEAVQKFIEWEHRQHQGLDPKTILAQLEQIRFEELEKHRKKIQIESEQLEKVHYMTQVMMKRVLSFILKQQKEHSNQEKEAEFSEFQLDELLYQNEEEPHT